MPFQAMMSPNQSLAAILDPALCYNQISQINIHSLDGYMFRLWIHLLGCASRVQIVWTESNKNDHEPTNYNPWSTWSEIHFPQNPLLVYFDCLMHSVLVFQELMSN